MVDLERATTAMVDEAAAAARRLPRRDPGLAPPTLAQSDRIRALIHTFPVGIFCMIVIGEHLRRMLGD